MLAIAALAKGCVSTPMLDQLELEDLSGLPSTIHLKDVPFFPQDPKQCGPAALATVLKYHNQLVSPQDLEPHLYIPLKKGAITTELQAYVRSRGLIPYKLHGGLQQIIRELAAGYPVIVLQNLGFTYLPQWHYAVVVGYDLERNHFRLRSGTVKNLLQEFATFESTWARGNYWAIIVQKPDTLSLTVTPERTLEELIHIESSDLKSASIGYREMTRRWPKFKKSWFAYGNASYLLGQVDEALNAFRRAVDIDPCFTFGLNNLAHIYWTKGQLTKAREFLKRGLRCEPKSRLLLSTLKEFNGHQSM